MNRLFLERSGRRGRVRVMPMQSAGNRAMNELVVRATGRLPAYDDAVA